MLSDFGISPAASLRVTLPPFEGNKRKKAKELLSWSLRPSPPPPSFYYETAQQYEIFRKEFRSRRHVSEYI